MSRVYFHSPSGDAELLGAERHWLGSLISKLATGLLDAEHNREILARLLPPGHSLAGRSSQPNWPELYALYFRSGDGALVQHSGRDLSTFSFALNTAAAMGSDAVKLAARIHGQCEIHAWVDGPNRAWIADIMQAGLDSGAFRKGLWHKPAGSSERKWVSMGWEDVITLLRSRADEPVVTSYSVCDSFPDPFVGDWMKQVPDGVDRARQDDAWYELDDAERWARSMAGLRESSGGLEIKPDDWRSFRFTHELTVLDLVAADAEGRLEAAATRLAAGADA